MEKSFVRLIRAIPPARLRLCNVILLVKLIAKVQEGVLILIRRKVFVEDVHLQKDWVKYVDQMRYAMEVHA
jgi:hypothetical protein